MRKKIPAVSFLVPSKHENKATMGERLSKQVVKVFPIITSAEVSYSAITITVTGI